MVRKFWNADKGLFRIAIDVAKSKNHKSIIVREIADQLRNAKLNYNNYLLDGKMTDELIASSILLAKLDSYYRNRNEFINFQQLNPDDIQDLRNLYSLIDDTIFRTNKKCFLNPIFGQGSKLVGGADADLILDETLIEIKTSNEFLLKRETLNQLLSYYILSLIGGLNGNPDEKPIKNLGIYFARHAFLWKLPLEEFGDSKKFADFKEWFMNYFSDHKNLYRNFVSKFMSNIKDATDQEQTT